MSPAGYTGRGRRKAILTFSLGLAILVISQILSLHLIYLFHKKHKYEKVAVLKAGSTEVIKLNYEDVVLVKYNITFEVDEPSQVSIVFLGRSNRILEAETYLITKENKTVYGEFLAEDDLDRLEITVLDSFEMPCRLTLTYTSSPGIYHVASIMSVFLGILGLAISTYGVYHMILSRR